MFEQICIQDDFLEIKNYFIYRQKEYGFDIDLFKRSSMYFQENFHELQKQKHINLIKHEYEQILVLPEDIINDFIRYCHNQKISISIDNVVSLNYLAKQYKVINLIKTTDKIILDHKSELALQILSFYNGIDDSNNEDIISDNFFEYINKEQIFLLQIPVLYRIISKNLQILQTDDQNSNKEKLIEFLFQCLSKFGRKASVLFSEIDFEKIEARYLNRLLTEFSEVFDFHFFNMTFLKKSYEIQSESIKFQEIQKKILNDQNLLKKENDQLKIQMIQIQNMLNQLEMVKKENKEIHEQNEVIQKEIDKTKNENSNFLQMISKMSKEIQNINEKLINVSNENQKLKGEMQSLELKLKNESNENQKLKTEIQSHESKLNNLSNENQKLKTEMQSHESKLNNVSNENQKLKNDIQTFNSNLSNLSDENRVIRNENHDIKSSIEKIKTETQANNTKIHEIVSNGKVKKNIHYNNKPFDGIIKYLTEIYGGNVNDLGIVNVTSKDHYSNYYPKNVVDLDSDSVFESQNSKDEWLCFDFGKNRITPTSYTIKTYDDTIGWTSSEAVTGEWNLKSWIIEVSIDGNNWIEIDRRENNYDLNSPNAFKNFTVKKKIECRYLRLHQIGFNHKGYYYIVLKAFEIFGDLKIQLF